MKIEVSAKSIEKAIEEGLKKLNTTIENVTVNVITEGGLFKKAKIEMIMDDDKDIKDEIFDLEEKFKLDLWYVNNYSLKLDIKILFMTIYKVLKRDGINQGMEVTMERFNGMN